jgi:hypothetical protein
MEMPKDLSRPNPVDELQLMRALLWMERTEQNTPGTRLDLGPWLSASEIQLQLCESIYQGLAPDFLTGMSLLQILATAGEEEEAVSNTDEDWSDDEYEDDEDEDEDDDEDDDEDEFEDLIDDEDWDDDEDDLDDEDEDEDWDDDDDEDDDEAPFVDDEDDDMPIDKELL